MATTKRLRTKPYPLEDIRTFLTRRNWITHHPTVLSEEEYAQLKARTLRLSAARVTYLRAFIDGYLMARP